MSAWCVNKQLFANNFTVWTLNRISLICKIHSADSSYKLALNVCMSRVFQFRSGLSEVIMILQFFCISFRRVHSDYMVSLSAHYLKQISINSKLLNSLNLEWISIASILLHSYLNFKSCCSMACYKSQVWRLQNDLISRKKQRNLEAETENFSNFPLPSIQLWNYCHKDVSNIDTAFSLANVQSETLL